MAQVRADGVDLFYETTGTGDPLVLVHGSWTDRAVWQSAIDADLKVEEVAMGPGAWDQLPQSTRESFTAHAQTWLDEQSDPQWASLDLDGLAGCTVPVMLSRGTQSPAWFAAVLDRLAEALPRARRTTFEGAGHMPHVTHPRDYAAALTGFARET
ncbi:alpha/beta fold hydrolase [Streptomyces sp. NPDC056485]|uniref:alpha/beta fold hydrolase n=1 Tax=Streptomyces sp. NPDC056485 TaxID=3345834 RepID=UPI003673BEBD